MEITTENWTHTHYQKSDLLAQITLGAVPNGDEADIFYYITVLRQDEDGERFSEVFQKRERDLESALNYLNSKYREWQFIDRTVTSEESDGGGCGSCAAH